MFKSVSDAILQAHLHDFTLQTKTQAIGPASEVSMYHNYTHSGY